MDDKNIKEKKLYKLIEHYFGKDLCSGSTYINDINFVSDDVDAFFEDYAKVFNVNMEDYNYYDYFHENFIPFSYSISKLLVSLKLRGKKIPLSISHLLLVIEKGFWFRP